MSAVVLDSKDDIIKFLQILAEESVSSARETIEKDTQQERTMSHLKMDSEIYDLSEQPEDAADDSPEAASDETEVDVDAEEVDVEDPAPEQSGSEETLEVSLDSITDALNQSVVEDLQKISK